MTDKNQIPQEIITHNEEKTIFNKVVLVNGLPEGESITYKAEGELIQKMNFKAGKLEGDLLYYENGKVKSKIPFKNNLQDGEAIYYDKDGKVIGKENYKEGRREGKSEWEDANGNKLFTSNYREGKLDGEQLEYHLNGKIKKKKYLAAGKPIGKVEEFTKYGIKKNIVLKLLLNFFIL